MRINNMLIGILIVLAAITLAYVIFRDKKESKTGFIVGDIGILDNSINTRLVVPAVHNFTSQKSDPSVSIIIAKNPKEAESLLEEFISKYH